MRERILRFIDQENLLESKIDARTSTKTSIDSEISDLNEEINKARKEQVHP